MSTLQTQYKNYLKNNPDSKLSYEEWLMNLSKELAEATEEFKEDWDVTLMDGLENEPPYVSDDFQIGPNGAYEHVGNYLDLEYQDLLQYILDNGVKKEDRTGTGTLSVFGRQIRHKMSEGFPALTTKKLYMKGVIAELIWFLQGRTDLRYLLQNDCRIWTGDAYKVYDKDFDAENPPFSAPYPKRLTIEEFEKKILEDDEFDKHYGDLGPIYGKQWRWWGYEPQTEERGYGIKGIDQIAQAIHKLKKNPDDRGIIVSAWNVSDLDQMTLRPCHNFFQFYTRELSLVEMVRLAKYENEEELIKTRKDNINEISERLLKDNIPTRAISLMFNMRSNDVPLGLPFNLASYGLLLEIFGKMVNMVPDELIANLGDAHIYLNQIDGIKEQLSREPFGLPKLTHLKTDHFYKLLSEDLSLLGHLDINDFKLENYQSHPAIKIPLSN
jgi:thymidylate synthase